MVKFIAIAIVLSVLTGCATSNKQLQYLSLDMNKREVVDVLGNSKAVRGSTKSRAVNTIEVWEYELSRPNSAGKNTAAFIVGLLSFGIGFVGFIPQKEAYWITFLDGSLFSWGKAGDWNKIQQDIELRVYENK